MEFNEENFKNWLSALIDYADTQGVALQQFRFGMYKDPYSPGFAATRRYNEDAVDVSLWSDSGTRVLLNWFLLTQHSLTGGLLGALCDITNAFPRDVIHLENGGSFSK